MKKSLSCKKHNQQRKSTKKNKSKKHGRNMKGGDFLDEEKTQLLNMGFTNDQLQNLATINISMDEKMNKTSGVFNIVDIKP